MTTDIMYLRDISSSMDRISRYMKGLDFERFSMNEMVMDAVIRNLQIIGEASKKVSLEIREKYREIPWVEMTATGEFLIAEYASIDMLTVWDVVILLLRQLRPYIASVIEMEESQEEDY